MTRAIPESPAFIHLLVIPFCLNLAASIIFSPFAAAQSGGGFVELFNGEDLSGWIEMGEPGAFMVDDGAIFLAHPNNHPNWLRSEEEYENFILELEYRPVGWAEGGIYLQAPMHGDPGRSGLKIHLRHERTDPALRSTGALYDLRAPLAAANEPGNAWNRLRIHMDWPRLRVHMNDVLIHDLDMERSDDLRSRSRCGYIGFEDIGQEFRFRNVRIHELPGSEPAWTELFNGRDLSGWDAEGDAAFEVVDGEIVASGGDGVLSTTQSYGGFEFRTYFRTSPHANGGIFFRRAERSDAPDRYEVQIYNVPSATNPTGSLYGIVPAADSGCRSEEWCSMQLISDGPYARVQINGRIVAEAHDLSLPDSGHVAIQHHSEGPVQYKGLRIRSLGTE